LNELQGIDHLTSSFDGAFQPIYRQNIGQPVNLVTNDDSARFGDRWGPGAQRSAIAAGEIHVWRAGMDVFRDEEEALAVISDQEQRRRLDFHFARDRKRFAGRRAIVRTILCRYLGVAPHDVAIDDSGGKPVLGGDRVLEFNASSSGEMVLVAVASGRPVGVDVEYMAAGSRDWSLRLAERMFAPQEVQELRTRPADTQAHAFFQYWTRKEAFVKATGTGLLAPLDAFDVIASATETKIPVRFHERSASEPGDWAVVDLTPAPEYAAAVATTGSDWSLQLFTL